jgi:hypothetical protein
MNINIYQFIVNIAKGIVLLTTGIMLSGCDPIVMLIVRPIQESNTRVHIVAKKEYQTFDSVLIKGSLAVIPSRFQVAHRIANMNSQSDSLERLVLFNLGSWKEEHFRLLAGVVDTLSISNSKTTLILTDSARVYSYLKSQPLSGLFNHKLVVP